MQMLFYVCFGVGIGYMMISLLFGDLIGGIFEGEFDFDFDASIVPIKTIVIATFITIFGLAGTISMWSALGSLLSLSIALATALIVSYLEHKYIIVPLYKAQNTSAVEKQSLIGNKAIVAEEIPQGGFGKILYHVNGNTYNAPAKSEDGGCIERHNEVIITSIVRNTYFVKIKN